MIKSKIIIVDDNKDVLNALRILLKREFSETHFINNPNQLHALLNSVYPDVVLLDMNFKAGIHTGNEGIFWMNEVHKKHKSCSVVMLTAYGDVEIAVKAIKEGAADFVVKPWDNEKLIATLKSATELKRAKNEVNKLKSQQEHLNRDSNKEYSNIIGNSEGIKNVLNVIEKVAKTEANILITGENGTGKELVAREIHKKSKRGNEIFITVDMASLSESLFESEMFGHTKGAFTDAKEDRTGRFEATTDGTLFLDEIGNLSVSMQTKILTAIQNKTITPVGSNNLVPFNSRIISATNKNLHELIRQNLFREDLFFRINTINIEVPPLRERGEDIIILADHFLQLNCRKYEKPLIKFNSEAITSLMQYSWPGNIRELKHTIEKAVILSESKILTPKNLLFTPSQDDNTILNKKVSLEEMEKWTIDKSLQRNKGIMSRVAKELGITRSTLYKKIKKYGL